MSEAVGEYAERILTETREELVRADGKASLLLAASGVVLGVALAAVVNGKWEPGDLASGATVVFAAGAGLYLVAICALGYAVWPRIRREDETRPADYFGDIINYKRPEHRPALRKALERGAENPERAISQLVTISVIVWKKYVGIRVALRLFTVSLLLCAGAVLLG